MKVRVQLQGRVPTVTDLLEVVGEAVRNQTRKRIAAKGDEVSKWPTPRFSNAFSTVSRIGELLKSLDYQVGHDEVFIGTRYRWVRHFQYGSIGAGGSLPDIVPVAKKALFIPLTNRAAKSRLVRGLRVGLKTTKGRGEVDVDLKRGRLRGGVMEVRRRQGNKWVWLPGQADFILLKRVKTPPHPVFRLTPDNRKEIRDVMADTFGL
jgi:phage gpG-like protein